MAYCGDFGAAGCGPASFGACGPVGGACGPAGFGGCGPVDACGPVGFGACAPAIACAPMPAPMPMATVAAAPVAHTAVEAWGRPVWKKNWLFGKWKYAGLKNVQYIPRTHVGEVPFGTCAPGFGGGFGGCGPGGPMGFGGTCAPYC